MYVVVRADLLPGLQAAQACHAVRLFVEDEREADRRWYEQSNNLVLLQVPGQKELLEFYERACGSKVLFREPDLEGEATAVASLDKKATSNLPLLLREPKQNPV